MSSYKWGLVRKFRGKEQEVVALFYREDHARRVAYKLNTPSKFDLSDRKNKRRRMWCVRNLEKQSNGTQTDD